MDDEPAPLAEPVVMAKFSTGANFAFEDRGTPVEISIGGPAAALARRIVDE